MDWLLLFIEGYQDKKKVEKKISSKEFTGKHKPKQNQRKRLIIEVQIMNRCVTVKAQARPNQSIRNWLNHIHRLALKQGINPNLLLFSFQMCLALRQTETHDTKRWDAPPLGFFENRKWKIVNLFEV